MHLPHKSYPSVSLVIVSQALLIIVSPSCLILVVRWANLSYCCCCCYCCNSANRLHSHTVVFLLPLCVCHDSPPRWLLSFLCPIVNNDDTLKIDWEIRRQKQNERLLEVHRCCCLPGSDSPSYACPLVPFIAPVHCCLAVIPWRSC